MNNPVAWFEIYVDDMARATAFYSTVFGVTFKKLENPELDIQAFDMNHDLYGASGALVHMPGFPAGHNSVLVYFHCRDCAVELARVEQAGGKIQKPKTSIGQYGHIALVTDSEGNMIGLHSA